MLPGATEEREGPPRAATTTVRLHSDGSITLHRSGAQDRAYPNGEAYPDHLRTAYRLAGGRTPPEDDRHRPPVERPA